VDVLPDRTAQTVATWMQAHPKVKIVTRDRAEAYASGVKQGAPQAIQVADRWHLLKNLREAAEEELRGRPILPWRPPSRPPPQNPRVPLSIQSRCPLLRFIPTPLLAVERRRPANAAAANAWSNTSRPVSSSTTDCPSP